MAATNSSLPQLFSGGNEVANLMLSTGLLEKGWSCVRELEQQRDRPPFAFKVYKDISPNFTIVAFSSSGDPPLEHFLEKLNGSSPLRFLITGDNSEISIHRQSLSAFDHLLENNDLTDELKILQLEKPEVPKQKQLILVGRSLGGSVAALFALWLLKKRSDAAEHKEDQIITPICITYGSPFIGDAGLQRAVSNAKKLKAQFWHIVRHGDVFPHAQLVPGASAEFKPFGTYFFCSKSGCTCIDHPETVLDVLRIRSPDQRDQEPEYGALLQQLKEKIKHTSNAQPQGNSTLRIGLALQLQALGIAPSDESVASLLEDMEDRETFVDIKRKGAQNPSKKFNDAKKRMALLEWYKKRCEDGEMDYYDCFKERSAERDYDVINFRNFLNRYWKDEVEEAENNPQSVDAPLRDRWLFSSTTYRLMVEPLDIADYYRKPTNRDYMKNKRAHHYEMLEKWHKEAKKEARTEGKAPTLTQDSCFWAHVEEAALTLNVLKEKRQQGEPVEKLRDDLKDFENLAWTWISNNQLSATVFFEDSTFMKWWKQYRSELEHDSEFTRYMRDLSKSTNENSANIC